MMWRRTSLVFLVGLGMAHPAFAQADAQVPEAYADVQADRPIACVRQNVEAGVVVIRATTSDRCAAPVAVRRVQASWRDAFHAPRYCHAQGTACSFELGEDRRWDEVETPTS